MQLEIGQVYEGTVTGITQYGAFVEVHPSESECVTGMVHISEIADTFVRDIHDFLHESDTVQVRMIGVNPQGKISFSMRQAAEKKDDAEQMPHQQAPRPKRKDSARPRVYEPKPVIPQSEMSFDDKLLQFKKVSEEKICDLKRGSERRGGSRSRRS